MTPVSRFRYFSPRLAAEILKRDNYTCIYCGKPATVVDHVVSWELGGKTTKSNGVSCCKSCNKLKESDSGSNYLVKGMTYIAGISGKKKGKR